MRAVRSAPDQANLDCANDRPRRGGEGGVMATDDAARRARWEAVASEGGGTRRSDDRDVLRWIETGKWPPRSPAYWQSDLSRIAALIQRTEAAVLKRCAGQLRTVREDGMVPSDLADEWEKEAENG